MRVAAYALLLLAASARILMQVAAMPPYAGLDEIQHVAHLAFVAQEHRSPTTTEPSIPPYLDASIHQRPGALPSFAQIAERWPHVVRANPHLIVDRPFSSSDLRPYTSANYEAQQPAIYYLLVAPLSPHATALDDLRRWRLVSALFAIAIVLATAAAGEALFGIAGLAAGALILLLPTWMTLVVRAGNDALACACVAAAFAITARAPRRIVGWIVEGLLWAGAFAVKLYTWPLAAVVAWMWWRQRASRGRIAIVTLGSAASAALTLLDLAHRTRNALGVVAFDRPGGAPLDSGLHIGEIVRVTIASAAWTSGQHWNALTPLAIAIYVLPLLIVFAIVMRRVKPPLSIAAVALIAFGCAQAFNVISCVLARRAGNPVPVGGKEGWYWYVLAPIVIATIVPPLLNRARTAVVLSFAWLMLWDVVITEGALFHDYAGATSPAHPTQLFRWGSFFAPFTADLTRVAAGPLTSDVTLLRIVHVVATGVLLAHPRSYSHSIVDGGFEETS